MISKNTKEEALTLWLQGKSMALVAQMLNLPVKTIRCWHTRYNWAEKREEIESRTRQALYFKFVSQIEKSTARSLSASLLCGQMVLEELQRMYESSDRDIDLLYQVVKIAEIGSRIHKNVVPDADEALMNRMLEELRSLREMRFAK